MAFVAHDCHAGRIPHAPVCSPTTQQPHGWDPPKLCYLSPSLVHHGRAHHDALFAYGVYIPSLLTCVQVGEGEGKKAHLGCTYTCNTGAAWDGGKGATEGDTASGWRASGCPPTNVNTARTLMLFSESKMTTRERVTACSTADLSAPRACFSATESAKRAAAVSAPDDEKTEKEKKLHPAPLPSPKAHPGRRRCDPGRPTPRRRPSPRAPLRAARRLARPPVRSSRWPGGRTAPPAPSRPAAAPRPAGPSVAARAVRLPRPCGIDAGCPSGRFFTRLRLNGCVWAAGGRGVAFVAGLFA